MSVPSDVNRLRDQGMPSRPVPTRPAEVKGRRRLSGSRRKLVLTVHLVAVLSLLGASIAMLVGGLYAATRDDPQDAHAIYSLLRLFTFTLDIPLAFIGLLGGLALARTSRWRVFRYWWVTGKLTLFVATITLGITLIGPSIDTMLDVTEASSPGESSTRWRLVAVAAAQVAMLLAAATLGVFKPGGRTRWPGAHGD
jgi:Predicted integral membrane protein (DUF2269)